MIKAVLVDIDDTLLDFTKCAAYAIDNAAKELNLKLPADFAQSFIRINRGIWIRLEKKEITASELYQTRFDTIFAETGVSFDGKTFEKSYQKYLDLSSEKMDGAEEMLRELSKKYKLFGASNAMYDQQKKRLERAGLFKYLDGMFISESIGHSKPTREYFEYCLDALKPLCKDEIIMVGDSIGTDITGAVQTGIPTLWLNIGGGEPSDLPDMTASALSEVPALIEKYSNG